MLLFSWDHVKKTNREFENIDVMHRHGFSSAHWTLNEMCFSVSLRCRQRCLGSLCLAVFIYCQAWSWSAILFVADPLPASTIQTHEGETLTRRMRRKPAHLGMTKTFKAFSSQPDLFCDSDEQHMEKDILYFRRHVLFVFPWTLRFVEPPQNEVRACSSCQTACSIEILPPLMRSRGKTNF